MSYGSVGDAGSLSVNADVGPLLLACERAHYYGDVVVSFRGGRVAAVTSGQEMRQGDQVQLFIRRLLGTKEKPP